ncbi:UDP-N-acetylmuramoyl-L-alanine--D-glutamate ligase [Prochlorococcus sp. MIT 1300]|uniref:UDP-N-acetylmuramoyl-L-alanine--D-glutamate ligase n=1 Tax=Prochlorococcus sp. MIT 1300 TaxID=3096218 RepID=UPI002A75C49A|nr:UDP-N-acetylmuramoyl-L-alanine--D-glutamate ligase [Prochlorococcus sp. MIT 1300]
MISTFLIIGLGRSGIGAARLLNHQGHKVVVLEESKETSLKAIAEELSLEGIEVRLGTQLTIPNSTPWLNNTQSIIISPGVHWDHPTLVSLREKGVCIKSEVTLAWEHLNHHPWIGITGTNGKTTVTHLLNHILKANGIAAIMGGNMGNPACEIALKSLASKTKELKDLEWLVMELSSYQIEASPQIYPQIGIWTNITPDHLERHKTFQRYRDIKKGLLERSTIRILNGDDPELVKQAQAWNKCIWISTKGPDRQKYPADIWINENDIVVAKGEKLFHTSNFSLPGQHNLQNLLLATAAALQVGIKPEEIAESLNSFSGVKHRLEYIGNMHNLLIFNDSKATNFDASIVGIDAIQEPAIVVCGGRVKKGISPSDWAKKIQEKACGIVLFGEAANELKNVLANSGFTGELLCCLELTEAVRKARELTQRLNAKSLILSPACSSFDQYKSYEERGDHFKSLIKQMLEE